MEMRCNACGGAFDNSDSRKCPSCGEDRDLVMMRLWKLKNK
jgi:rRNA maturation endonuclease Nob1